MSSSNIQIIRNLIKTSLTLLSINVFTEFKKQNSFLKTYRTCTAVLVIFCYLFAFIYAFIVNSQNLTEDLLADQFLLFNAIVGIITIYIRILMAVINQKTFVAIFDWILEMHESETPEALQKYVGTKYEKLGSYYVKIWR